MRVGGTSQLRGYQAGTKCRISKIYANILILDTSNTSTTDDFPQKMPIELFKMVGMVDFTEIIERS